MEDAQQSPDWTDQVRNALRSVLDPEIGLNVVDLGFIKDISAEQDRVRIRMVLSAPFCPMAGFLVNQVRECAERVLPGRKVEVEILDEPWRPPWFEREAEM
jgi:metal-sulfur cluster biosynthetic enzyme